MNSKGVKRKRVVLDIPTKLRILDRLENGHKCVDLAKEFGVGKSTISDIKTAKDKIREFAVSCEGSTDGRHTMKPCADERLDKALFTWFTQERHRGTPLSGPIVKEKALWFHQQLNPDDDRTFTASEGWLQRWKNRHGIRQLSIQGEVLSSAGIETEPFKEDLATMMEENQLGPHQLYNADETALYWKLMPSKTLASAGEAQAPGFKKVKDRVSILACANASGSQKLPLLLIGKSQNPRCFKHVNMEKLPVTYRSQHNTWMTATIFKDWFSNVFVPKVKAHLLSMKLPLKAILLIDNCPAHPPDLVAKTSDGSIMCHFLPANTTSHLQPMDQGPLEVMKRHYRHLLIQTIVANEGVSVTEAIKSVSLKESLYMIDKAWRCVSDSHIQKAWVKSSICDCFPTQPDVTADDEPDLVAEQIKEELSKSTEPVNLSEVTDWLECDRAIESSEFLTDEAIVEHVTSPTEEEENEPAPTPAPKPRVSESRAYEGISTFLTWMRERHDFSPLEVLQIKTFVEKTRKIRDSAVKQKAISDFFTQ